MSMYKSSEQLPYLFERPARPSLRKGTPIAEEPRRQGSDQSTAASTIDVEVKPKGNKVDWNREAWGRSRC